jgi:hypothetical protein
MRTLHKHIQSESPSDITPSPPPLTVIQPQNFSLVIAWHSYCSDSFSFPLVFTPSDAAFKRKVVPFAEATDNRAAGGKYTVSDACVCHLRGIKTKLFSCLMKRKSIFLAKAREKSRD